MTINTDPTTISIVISGCGDIGTLVAQRWQDKGAKVMGLCRNDAAEQRLQAQDIEPIRADLDKPDSLQHLPLKDAILYHFAPPPASGETDLRIHALLESIQFNNLPRIIVMISTTAVYGDCNGAWVSEESPTHPQTARGKRRLDAEIALTHWGKTNHVPTVILRVPGIYGPGRLPLERIKSGEPILREEEAPYTNRIHADDLAMICVVAAEQGCGGCIYNISDNQPGNMSQYFKDIADAFGLPRPPEISREEAEKILSPGMLSYLKESRRIDNSKMINELGIELQYPDLASGLNAINKKLLQA